MNLVEESVLGAPDNKVKQCTIGDLFTVDEIKLATEFKDVDMIHDYITQPAIERINAVTNQENDSRFLAYLLLHIC